MTKREIEFRGKRIDNGEWVHGCLIGECYIVGEVTEFNQEYFNTEFWYAVDPKTVGQFIGLLDKNKIKIFEDDIISKRNVVTYVDDTEGANLGMDIGWYIQRDNFESWSMLTVGDEYEVIGNIHDNLNLL